MNRRPWPTHAGPRRACALRCPPRHALMAAALPLWLVAVLLTLAAIALGLAAPSAHAQGSGCNPQFQCCLGGSGSGAPACAVSAGNPLNVLTGNKYQREVDLPALPGVLGLELVRHYNSEHAGWRPGMPASRSIVGRGWRLSYDTVLHLSVGGDPQAIVHISADGTHTTYRSTPEHPQRYSAGDPVLGFIERVDGMDAGDTAVYHLHLPDGHQHHFNAHGRLLRMAAPTGEQLRITRDAQGRITQVIDPQGRTLTLHYAARGGDGGGAAAGEQGTDDLIQLRHIDTPLGRYSYHHGAAPGTRIGPAQELLSLRAQQALRSSLTRVVHPDGSARIYHHDDLRHPTLLTGVSVQPAQADAPAQRLSTWAYDDAGRAVWFAPGLA